MNGMWMLEQLKRVSDQEKWAKVLNDALEGHRLKVLDEVEKAGCPHACAPPCPFNRKIASLRTQHVEKPTQ